LRDEGVLPSTEAKYTQILNSASTTDLVRWLRQTTDAKTPIGTLLPRRAAVKHYLIAVQKMTEAEADALLPKARGGKPQVREGLTAYQLALYNAAVDDIEREPVHTILFLLPLCGLRISEVCKLRVDNLRMANGRLLLELRGKGDKPRVVPLPARADAHLRTFLEEHRPQGWLFASPRGGPITPAAVRKVTRTIAASHPELGGLSPHVLRHTYATNVLRTGGNIKALQKLLGHQSIQTTQRYLHPTVEDLQDAVEGL
jgi:site-specific recombinase XerD